MKKIIWKIKYYFRRLFAVDWKGFFNAIDYAHKKSGKLRIIIFFDMIWCSLRYTAGYVDYNEFEFYLLNKKQRLTYVTLGQSHKVTREFNDRQSMRIFDDKTQFNKRFKKFVNRDFIDLNESDANELEAFVKSHGKVMAKRSDDYVGRGIKSFDANDITDYHEFYQKLIDNDQTLIEEFFTQHEVMSSLSPNSVNTMRVITFLDNNGEGQILVVALKSGLGADVDNIGQGGMYTILNDDGIVDVPFIDKLGNRHSIHPITGENLIGFQVPNYSHLLKQVKEACLIVPEVRYVGWDIAVSPEGNIEIIEGNSTSGPFQKIPSLTKDKTGVRPKYEEHIPMKF